MGGWGDKGIRGWGDGGIGDGRWRAYLYVQIRPGQEIFFCNGHFLMPLQSNIPRTCIFNLGKPQIFASM